MIDLTEADLLAVVQVGSDIETGWSDHEEFQQLVERVLLDVLDRDSALQTITTETAVGDTVGLGTVTLEPDGTLVEHSLSPPG